MIKQFAVVVLLALLVTSAAHAHEGQGAIEVITADATAPLQIEYRVRLTFVSDGHPESNATVTVVAERAGTALTPQPMPPTGEDGVYAATVAFPSPGSWTVRFTAVKPPATLERLESVAAPPTSLRPTTTATPDERGEDDSGNVRALIGIGAVALVGAGALVSWRRRRRSDPA